MQKNWIFYFVLVITFLVGGALQLIGLATTTLLTIAVSVIALLHIYYRAIVLGKPIKLFFMPFGILTGLITISSIINSTNPQFAFLYFWLFVLVPFMVYYLVKNYLNRIGFEKVINFLVFISVIQLPVMILQAKFYSLLISFSARQIAEVDFSFGTFFLANDHALCFLVLCVFTFLLFNNYKTPYFNKFVYISWLALTITISNSKISFILLAAIIIIYFILRAYTKLLITICVIATSFILVISILPNSYHYVEEKTAKIFSKVSSAEDEQHALARAIELGNAERTQIFFYYLNKPIKIIGEGPYNYWNPETKRFNLFPNFSQVLWFYNDLGILSIVALIFFYSYFYWKNKKLFSYEVIYLAMIIIFSYFTNTMTDLAFNLTFFIFILGQNGKPNYKINRIKHEPSMHTLPRLEKN